MKVLPRLLWLTAVLSLLVMYVAPIWRITINAPQYPGGINMYIYIDKIGGDNDHTLQNINILNHYIGMRPIEPDSIPELRIMPVVIGIIIGLGLLGVALNRRWILYSWLAILLIAGTIGLVDFWLWEYDYGHNLDPKAPIKVPGMTYQPPFLGSKVLLNIVATSYPALGGIMAGVSVALASLAAFLAFRGRKCSKALNYA